jgi:RNA 2',3'-cyclic 3'-phosphodiesterase
VTDRLFFALWPGAAEREALVGLQRELPSRRGRPTHRDDLHLTLAFLGEIDPERRAGCEAAAGAVRCPAFTLSLSGIGYWPRPRILWCGTLVPPPPLLTLVRVLTEGLRRCGFPGERRPYAAHITLARKVPAPRAEEVRHAWRLDWPVSGFVLAASTEGPAPRYRVVRDWALQTASPEPPLCDNGAL